MTADIGSFRAVTEGLQESVQAEAPPREVRADPRCNDKVDAYNCSRQPGHTGMHVNYDMTKTPPRPQAHWLNRPAEPVDQSLVS